MKVIVTILLAVFVSMGILSIKFDSKVYEPKATYTPKTSWDNLMEYVGLEEYKLDKLFPN